MLNNHLSCVKPHLTDSLDKPRPLPPLTNDTEVDAVVLKAMAVSYYQRVRSPVVGHCVAD